MTTHETDWPLAKSIAHAIGPPPIGSDQVPPGGDAPGDYVRG
jgi:hypothetical protein